MKQQPALDLPSVTLPPLYLQTFLPVKLQQNMLNVSVLHLVRPVLPQVVNQRASTCAPSNYIHWVTTYPTLSFTGRQKTILQVL